MAIFRVDTLPLPRSNTFGNEQFGLIQDMRQGLKADAAAAHSSRIPHS